GALRPAEQRGQHLAGLVAVVVDRLFAKDDQAGLLRPDDGFQDLGDGERLDRAVGLHQDAAVGAHRERGADGFGGLRRPDRHGDDLARLAGFLQPDRLFDGDLVEGIHRHLDVGQFDAGAVRLDPDLDVEIDDPLHGHENFHDLPSGTGFWQGAAEANGRASGVSTFMLRRNARLGYFPGFRPVGHSRAHALEQFHAGRPQYQEQQRADGKPADM